MSESPQIVSQISDNPGMELAKAYARVFTNGDGDTVLDDLDLRFRARDIYVAGTDGERETQRRAAQKEVVDWILRMLVRAQHGDRNDEA